MSVGGGRRGRRRCRQRRRLRCRAVRGVTGASGSCQGDGGEEQGIEGAGTVHGHVSSAPADGIPSHLLCVRAHGFRCQHKTAVCSPSRPKLGQVIVGRRFLDKSGAPTRIAQARLQSLSVNEQGQANSGVRLLLVMRPSLSPLRPLQSRWLTPAIFLAVVGVLRLR